MKIIILLVIAILLLSPVLANAAGWSEGDCNKNGGTYAKAGSACEGTCEYERATESMSCIAIVVPSCICGDNKCWNTKKLRCEKTVLE